jgi:hypothetical protein
MQVNDQRVYFISCVSKKRKVQSAACDLYDSPLFQKARAYVEASRCPWFILSAEYGLVSPEQSIEPYERTLNRMGIAARRQWAECVLVQLTKMIPNMTTAVFLAGKCYREFLERPLMDRGVEVLTPMKGLRIGEQLRWLGQHMPRVT